MLPSSSPLSHEQLMGYVKRCQKRGVLTFVLYTFAAIFLPFQQLPLAPLFNLLAPACLLFTMPSYFTIFLKGRHDKVALRGATLGFFCALGGIFLLLTSVFLSRTLIK